MVQRFRFLFIFTTVFFILTTTVVENFVFADEQTQEDKKKCDELIRNIDVTDPDLFTQLLECEISDDEFFAGVGTLGPGGDAPTSFSTPNTDITSTSFSARGSTDSGTTGTPISEGSTSDGGTAGSPTAGSETATDSGTIGTPISEGSTSDGGTAGLPTTGSGTTTDSGTAGSPGDGGDDGSSDGGTTVTPCFPCKG